jgi:ubiquitin-protein ligase
MLEGWELQNKFILDVNPMELFSSNKPPPRFNKTTMIPRFHEKGTIVIQGRILPQTEPYCRASFLLEIKLPPGYPYKPSEIIFLDPIYHPNVDESGKNCSSWGYPDEKFIAATTLVKIIENIIRIIDSVPDYGHSDNHQCAREHQFDYQTFYAKALERTLSYGRPRY